MSELPAISVQHLSKSFGLWESTEERFKHLVGSQFGLRPKGAKEFRALDDISFEVSRGESMAVIGLNGSGKSTLLQIIAGTMQPSAGQARTRGRVAALLELGSGFNPLFTGRENVFLNAAVLGLTREETETRFAAIAEFADIGAFMDQPVKTYSSGMHVRLAFAVLSQVDPDILIVDEALSVGDFLFQQKCYDRIREFRRRGCTFLFVSHGMGTVLELCQRAIVLDRGQMIFNGSPKEAVDLYEAHALRTRFGITPGQPQARKAATSAVAETPPDMEAVAPVSAAPAIASETLTLLAVRVLDATGAEKQFIVSGQQVQVRIAVRFHRAVDDPHLGFKIRTKLGVVIYETNTYCLGAFAGPIPAGKEIEATFHLNLPLIEGEYGITAGIANRGRGRAEFAEALHFQHDVCHFAVIRDWTAPHWAGTVNLQAKASVQTLGTPP